MKHTWEKLTCEGHNIGWYCRNCGDSAGHGRSHASVLMNDSPPTDWLITTGIGEECKEKGVVSVSVSFGLWDRIKGWIGI